MSLTQTIKDEIKYYKEEVIDVNPVYCQTQPQVLKMIKNYSNSKFGENEYDSQGNKKPFFNVSDNPRWIAAKMIDFDQKDINVITESGHDEHIGWLLEKELLYWMKDNQIGMMINQIVENLPKWGTVVLKRVKGNIQFVNLENLIVDPTAETLNDSQFIDERHEYTPNELRRQGKKKGWNTDNIEAVIENAKAHKKQRIEVWERYGEVEDSENNFHIIAGMDLGLTDEEALLYEGKKDPEYKEVHWEKEYGRWLGIGQIEKLFEAQIAKNEMYYYFHRGIEITSLNIFQTRDENFTKNLLTELENGDILRTLSEITPIAVEERNLPAYNFADQLWNKNISDRAFAHEPLSGQRPAAGTPWHTTQLQAAMAGQYYGFKQQYLAFFFKDILYTWVIPNFKSEVSGSHKKHLMKLLGTGEDGQRMFNAILASKMRDRQAEFAQKGRMLFGAEYDIIKSIEVERLKRGDFEIPDGLYENVKYKIDIIITGERLETAGKISVLQTILQITGQNPQVMQNPETRRIVFKIMDWAGVNPVSIFGQEPQGIQQMAQQVAGQQRGGSLPAPTPVGQGQALQQQQATI